MGFLNSIINLICQREEKLIQELSNFINKVDIFLVFFINLKYSKSVGLFFCIVYVLDKIVDIGIKQMNVNFQIDWG